MSSPKLAEESPPRTQRGDPVATSLHWSRLPKIRLDPSIQRLRCAIKQPTSLHGHAEAVVDQASAECLDATGSESSPRHPDKHEDQRERRKHDHHEDVGHGSPCSVSLPRQMQADGETCAEGKRRGVVFRDPRSPATCGSSVHGSRAWDALNVRLMDLALQGRGCTRAGT